MGVLTRYLFAKPTLSVSYYRLGTLRRSLYLRIESGLQVLRLLAEGVGMSMRRGAAERLVPILMTAPATALGLGLLPLALGSGVPGREIEGPMALSSGAVCRPPRP